jgi:hypothetical protein
MLVYVRDRRESLVDLVDILGLRVQRVVVDIRGVVSIHFGLALQI